MSKNMGVTDRSVRAVLGLVLGYLSLSGVLAGAMAVAAGIVGVVLVATALVGVCPLYIPLGISTRRHLPGTFAGTGGRTSGS